MQQTEMVALMASSHCEMIPIGLVMCLHFVIYFIVQMGNSMGAVILKFHEYDRILNMR